MTDKDQQLISAILTTLLDTDGSPESILYLGTGADLEKWNQIRYALTSAGLITVDNYYVTLTDHGRYLARKIDALMMAAQAKLNAAGV